MNIIEIPDTEWDSYLKYEKISHKKLHIRLQCYASKFALNDCYEDMNELSKQGVYAATLSVRTYESCITHEETASYNFDLRIISREDMREIRKRDYVIYPRSYHAHMFFEIPVIAKFTEHQVDKWQDFCFRRLAQIALSNKLKAREWLLQKQLKADFE